MTMLAYGLMNVNREALVPFFEIVHDLFQSHHHSEKQDPEGYEELLYRISRPYSSHTLDLIDELSAWAPIEANDLLFCGTPSGVGPMQCGDRVQARLLDEHSTVISELDFLLA